MTERHNIGVRGVDWCENRGDRLVSDELCRSKEEEEEADVHGLASSGNLCL